MKILYHHRTLSKDGQNVHIEELTAAFRRCGHEVFVVGPPHSENSNSVGSLLATLRQRLPAWTSELLELAYNLAAYRRLERILRRWQPDILYERYNLFLIAGVWLKRKYGIPYLVEVNSPLAKERREFGNLSLLSLAEKTESMAWCGADFVLPVSQVLARMIQEVGVQPERIVVVPNGVDWTRFNGVIDSCRAKCALGVEDSLVLGFVGFVRDWHGLDVAIDTIAKADESLNLHLVIAGDGPALPQLRRRADALEVSHRITFLGNVPRKRIADVISAFDVALQPAVVPYASPLKLFEYMALGKAIIAPTTLNIREILTDGENALLFDPASSGAFEDCLVTLCQDKNLRRRLGEAAQRTIVERRLTWEENARRIEELSEILISTSWKP